METQKISDKIKLMANLVEKFVENNLIEKEQRDENFRKLAIAFETFVKDKKLNMNISRPFASGQGFSKVSLKMKKLSHFKGDLPKYQSSGASGFDVRAQLSEEIELKPGQRALIPTGLSFALPEGYEIQARPRSGLAIREGLGLVNSPGTIDADYRGEIKIIVINMGEKPFIVKDQERIAQLVVAPVVHADFQLVTDLEDTDRGSGGFGSTGRS